MKHSRFRDIGHRTTVPPSREISTLAVASDGTTLFELGNRLWPHRTEAPEVSIRLCSAREQGLDAVLTRKQRTTPPVAPIFDGEQEAKLIALACSSAPAGHARWTLRLLEEKVVELKIVDGASDNTIGRVLKKTNLNLTARSTGLSHRSRIARS